MRADSPALPRLERQIRQLHTLSRALLWIVPLLLLAAALDLGSWLQRGRQPLAALAPNLEDLRGPLPEVPTLSLPSGLFEAPEVVQPKKGAASVAVEEVPWKLKAVILGGTKRAYLEKEDGSSAVWVSEGEKVSGLRIQGIQERAVTVESEEGTYELRL